MAALTPLAVAALAILTEGPRHPYEIHQLLVQRHRDMVVKLRPSSLYNTIERLEREGLVESLGTDREGNRPERTTYQLTDRGRKALSDRIGEMLATPAQEFPEADFAFSEAHFFPRKQVEDLITVRIAALRARLAELEYVRTTYTGTHVQQRYLVHVPYRIALLTAEIQWLESWHHDLETGELDWFDGEHPDWCDCAHPDS